MSDAAQKIDWTGPSPDRGSLDATHPIRLRNGASGLRNSHVKRMVDILGAGCGLVVLLPLLVLIGLFIILESQGPVFFRQRRTGRDGSVFSIYKFRTMTVMEDGADILQAIRGDHRVTWFGGFLRRSSFDELPQLINVLTGEMSLVGPRPHAVAHDQYYAQVVPNYPLRFHAKPGITGMAQVAGFRGEIRDISHMQARVDHDLEYIENWSLGTDVKILILTLTVAPFHRTAY